MRRTDLLFKRIDFVCMAQRLKIRMERETGCKQLKRYLKTYCRMDEETAQHSADKFNEGCRIYKKLPLILNNCAQCPSIDIRDFTVKELSLAVNLSWVIRRSALVKATKRKTVAADMPVAVDERSVQQSVDEILSSKWYSEAKDNPALVANILNRIGEKVVNTSLYDS